MKAAAECILIFLGYVIMRHAIEIQDAFWEGVVSIIGAMFIFNAGYVSAQED